MSAIVVPEEVLALGPWSVTMIDLAMNCPHAFNKKYRLREKATTPKREDTQVGTVVHRILELALGGPATASVENIMEQVLKTETVTYDVQLRVRTYRTAIKDFLQRLQTLRTTRGVLHQRQEVKVGLNPDFTSTNFFQAKFFRGAIDLSFKTRDNWGVIIDHKSGVRQEMEKYAKQLDAYGLFADVLYPGLKGVQGAIHFVGCDPNERGSRTEWGPTHSIEAVRTTLRQRLVDALIAAVKHVTDNQAPTKSWQCEYCDYSATCPLQ
jgi:CRISPR/Cas system-associated exonuclease Cas4 (RecB family)